mmetsp:Transcript_83548/g.233160  ORF Transcript_83548/g.233160 Transcript_83548/m.233160 type:complete len:240 (+) Transcript_83548:916-1635(+)
MDDVRAHLRAGRSPLEVAFPRLVPADGLPEPRRPGLLALLLLRPHEFVGDGQGPNSLARSGRGLENLLGRGLAASQQVEQLQLCLVQQTRQRRPHSGGKRLRLGLEPAKHAGSLARKVDEKPLVALVGCCLGGLHGAIQRPGHVQRPVQEVVDRAVYHLGGVLNVIHGEVGGLRHASHDACRALGGGGPRVEVDARRSSGIATSLGLLGLQAAERLSLGVEVRCPRLQQHQSRYINPLR